MKSRVEKIETQDAPKAIGPYSQGVAVDPTQSRLIFVSGQLPIDPMTGILVNGDIIAATKQVMKNIKGILEEAKSSMNEVVKVEIFLRDLNDFKLMNEEYGKHFNQDNYPARQTIQAARLPMDAQIEISCVAVQLIRLE